MVGNDDDNGFGLPVFSGQQFQYTYTSYNPTIYILFLIFLPGTFVLFKIPSDFTLIINSCFDIIERQHYLLDTLLLFSISV
jgi:hypothetical protein